MQSLTGVGGQPLADASAPPRALSGETTFRHKSVLQAALNAGATMRREVRTITAEHFYGLYRIRLNIARDPQIIKGHEAAAESTAIDIEYFLGNLAKDLTATTRVWHIRGADGQRFIFIENDSTGEPLGCLASWGQNPDSS